MSVFRVWHKLLRRLPAALGGSRKVRPDLESKKRRPLHLEVLEDRAVPATWYVAPTGSDQPGFGTDPNHPFATIQVAVNNATTGDTVKVAAGTYTYNAGSDLASSAFGTTGVISVFDKQLTILGGFSTGNWNLANPSVNPTIIDGGGTVRGVYVVYNVQPTGLDIEGFTIQNGVGTANTKQATTNAYGGGMYVDETANPTTTAPIVVQNVVFRNDTAQATAATTVGGSAFGGGFAIISGNNVTLSNVTFQNDKAVGGTGLVRGGMALGGGFYATSGAVVTGNNLTFTGNAADAGSTATGTGVDAGGATADALGGGLAVQNGASVSFATINVTGSTALGGSAAVSAGAGFGGGAFVQNAALSLQKATLSGNFAESGGGVTGNGAAGGGIAAVNADLTLNQATVSQNIAQGGNSTSGGAVGVTGGGGLYLVRNVAGQFGNTVSLTNTLIDDNAVGFGGSGVTANGGAGLFVQGVSASLTESTVANNLLGAGLSNGPSILALAGTGTTPTALALTNDIVGNVAAQASAAPLTIQSGAAVTVNRTLFVVPSSATPLDNGVNGQPAGALNTVNGSIDLLTASSAGFISPGAPNFNYGLLSSSPARGQAINNTVAVDRAGNPRPTGADLGAFQFVTETIQFQNLDTQVSKAAGQATITVVLSAAASVPVSVNYSTTGGTAQAGVDYTPVSGTLSFAVGETVKTFTIPVFDDGAATGDLRINLALSNPAGVSFGFQTEAVATILDDHPTDNDQFISGLYHDLLNRPADQGGVNFFITPLLGAEEPQLPGVLFQFVNTIGYFEQVVGNHTDGFYHRFLGEDLQPGDPNVTYWANQMATGMSDEQVIAAFLTSPQYLIAKSDGDAAIWLFNVYHDVLNRPIDPAGQSFWLSQLTSGSMSFGGVALSILSAAEYRVGLIKKDFQLYLNRPTNTTDRQFWLGEFQAGLTDEQVIEGIGGSIEGLAQNGGTNAAWFTTLYQKLLGRAPSADELSLQLNALENDAQAPFDNGYHLQRFNTARAILSSSEFAARGTFTLATDLNTVIAEVYQQGLHRSATAADQAFWSAQVRGDANVNLDVASAILASSEYFNDPHAYP